MPASLTDTSVWVAAPVGPAAGDPRTAASVTGPLSSLNQRIRFLLWYLGQINGNFASGSPSTLVSVVGDTIGCTSHGFTTTAPMRFQIGASGGGLPSPLVVGTVYFAINIDADHFQVSATSGGGAITLGAGFGGEVYALFVVDTFSNIFAPADAPYPAGTLREALATTVATSVLASTTTSSSGSRLVGVEAITGTSFNISASTLYAVLQAIANGVAWLAAANNPFTGNISVIGSTTCSGVLSVSGATACTALAASGNVTVAGTLGVTGACTFTAAGTTITASGAVACAGLGVTNNCLIGGTLTVGGLTTCSGGLALTGTLTSTGLTSSGLITCNAGITVSAAAPAICHGGLNMDGVGGLFLDQTQPTATAAVSANTFFATQMLKCYGVATWTGSSTIALDAATSGVNLNNTTPVSIVAGAGGAQDEVFVQFGTNLADAHYAVVIRAYDTVNAGAYTTAAQLIDCDPVSQSTAGFTFTAWNRILGSYFSLTGAVSSTGGTHNVRFEWFVFGRQ